MFDIYTKKRYISWHNKVNGLKTLWEFISERYMSHFSSHPSISIAWYNLAGNPNIDIISNNIFTPCEFTWYRSSASKNTNINIKYITDKDWSIYSFIYLAENSIMDPSYVIKNAHLFNNLHCLAANPRVTWRFIKDNPDFDWNHEYLSSNPNITIKIVKENPQIKWDHYTLSSNPAITWEDIISNPNIEWSPDRVSLNPNISIDIVLKNPRYCWNFEGLSKNAGITWDNILATPKLPWRYDMVAENPNITLEIILQEPLLLHLESICCNEFLYNETVFARTYNAAIKSRRQLVNSECDPIMGTYICAAIWKNALKYIGYE